MEFKDHAVTGTADAVGSAGDEPTRERVVRSILINGPSTAADLAERLHLTPAAVRRHLDHLLGDGVLEARDPRPTATRGRGRPAKVFAITEAGRDHFDQQYDDLAVQALRYLAETGGDEAVLEFARRRVAFIEHDYAIVTAAEPDLTPAEALAKVFSSEGYAASVRSLPLIDGLAAAEQLCQQHCPVSHVAHEFPQLCEAETEAIGKVLGRHVQRLATIAHGDGVCTTCIPHRSVVEEGALQPHVPVVEEGALQPHVPVVEEGALQPHVPVVEEGALRPSRNHPTRRPLVSTSSTDEEKR